MSGLFVWSSATFDKLFEKATSHLLLEPDWESILKICDCIRQQDVRPKYVLSCIKKKLYVQNPHVVLYTLQVLESCMKNCGTPFHTEVASRPFMEELKELVKTTTDDVKSRILELIQIWAHAFRNEPKYRAVQDLSNMLKMEGYKLQVLKESDAMFVVDTAPDWVDGYCCHQCRTQFTVVQRKHHCWNCGQIFCHKCSSRSCPIPRFGIEKDVRVCEACWGKLNKADGNCCYRCRTQFTVVQRKHQCQNCGQIFCNKCSSRSCPIPRFGIEKKVSVCDACWGKLNKADCKYCHRCRTQFTYVQSKHQCQHCGQIFCNKCSSRSCPIPRFGIEKDVRVCEACWGKLNKPVSVPKSASPNPEQSPQTTAQDAFSGSRKSEQELKDEEGLQLASALSQSEGETKKEKPLPVKPYLPSAVQKKKEISLFSDDDDLEDDIFSSVSKTKKPLKTAEKSKLSLFDDSIEVSKEKKTKKTEVKSSLFEDLVEKQKVSLKQAAYTYTASEETAPKMKSSPVNSELDHYLNRNYWEQRQQQQKEEVTSPTDSRNSPTSSAPISSSAPSYTSNRQTEAENNSNGFSVLADSDCEYLSASVQSLSPSDSNGKINGLRSSKGNRKFSFSDEEEKKLKPIESGKKSKRYVKVMDFCADNKFHIINFEDNLFISCGDLCRLLWKGKNSDFLLQKLTFKEVNIPFLKLVKEDHAELFRQLKWYKIPDAEQLNLNNSPLLLCPLNEAIFVLNIFGHPSVCLRLIIQDEIKRFDPHDTFWNEFICKDTNDIKNLQDDYLEEVDKLCLDDLKAKLEVLKIKMLKLKRNNSLSQKEEMEKIENSQSIIGRRIKQIEAICIKYSSSS